MYEIKLLAPITDNEWKSLARYIFIDVTVQADLGVHTNKVGVAAVAV